MSGHIREYVRLLCLLSALSRQRAGGWSRGRSNKGGQARAAAAGSGGSTSKNPLCCDERHRGSTRVAAAVLLEFWNSGDLEFWSLEVGVWGCGCGCGFRTWRWAATIAAARWAARVQPTEEGVWPSEVHHLDRILVIFSLAVISQLYPRCVDPCLLSAG